ncbi:MAG: hypothetical protein S4CHLAM2_07190 [Chlamydiales bacterium]|nr:hypothetical protein [Chlamydiales bacterium]
MSELLKRLFVTNWPRKLVAMLTAVFVWFLVNQTITITQTIPDVPIRIVNLPSDKTVVGLLPNGLLNKRVSIAVTGSKSVVKDLRPTDIEIVINADGQKESWIATIDKRNVVSMNQDFDLQKSITDVSANDIYIKLSKLITEEIPIIVTKPIGDPPKGFQFLDIWPKRLRQKISGPEEQVRALKERGLDLTLNLNRISQSELESLYNRQGKRDEITFKIPDAWKKVAIPFKENTLEAVNDPRADLLRIDFLKQELIPLGSELPITIFFPLKYSNTINPQTYSLATNEIVQKKSGLKRLTIPLYVRDVSRLFLDVVRDNLLLIIVAAPESVEEDLHWAVEFIDEKALEDAFVEASSQLVKEKFAEEENFTKYSEQAIRYRFRDYLRNLVLYTEDGLPIQLNAHLNASTITITQENP